MRDKRRSCEARSDVVATLGHQVGEPLTRELLIFRLEESEDDGQSVWGFGITVDDAFGPDVVLVECSPGAFGKAGEILSILMSAKKRCCISHDVRVPVKTGRCHHTVIG